MAHGEIIASPFMSPWWLPEQHSQTLLPGFFARRKPIATTTEKLELPDGDFVELAWTTRQQGPLIALFHGLEGGVNSGYIQGILTTVAQLGGQAVLMHFRGCGKEPNRLARWYHSGDSPDIAFLVEVITQRFPGRPLGAFGVSLGGNALLKYLGEQGDRTPLQAAMAVSIPFELGTTAKRLTYGFSRVYQWYLSRLVKKKIRQKQKTLQLDIDPALLKTAKTFYDIDNMAAQLHGFANAEAYYALASAKQFLRYIERPTWILHSKNDPFLSPEAIPKVTDLAEQVTLELADSGGHAGFIYGKTPFQPRYWIDERFRRFYRQHFG